MNNLGLDIGANYVLLSGEIEVEVLAIIRVVDDRQITLNKMVQAIRDQIYLDDEDLVKVISLGYVNRKSKWKLKVKITKVSEEPYDEEFSLVKTEIY